MMALTEALLLHRLRGLAERSPDSRRPVALYSEARWSGPVTLAAGGIDWTIQEAPSPLAVRASLADAPAGGRLVLLTALDERALGADVLARLEEGRVMPLRPWAVLMERFRATAIDPRIDKGGLAQPLLEACPEEAFDPAPGGYLDLDLAWQMLARYALGFDHGTLDRAAVLGWLLSAEGRRRLAAAPTAVQTGFGAWIGGRLGPGGGLALALLQVDRLAEWPARLVLAEATARAPVADRAGPRAVIAHLAGCAEPSDETLIDLADALDGLAGPALEEAGRAAEQMFGAQRAVLAWSRHAPVGRRARAEAVAQALDAGDAAALEAAAAELERHHGVPEAERTLVTMAARLQRWLATPPPEAEDFEGLASWYLDAGSYVDRARHAALARLEGTTLAPAVRRLLDRVRAEREAINRAFAPRLLAWPRQAAGRLVPVEQVIDRVVAPLAQGRVLLLVLDGLSLAVAHELLEHLPAGQWQRVRHEGVDAAVATVPSVTELARTALFTGRPGRGGQSEERAGLANHPRLRGTRPAPIFHEASLRSAGDGLGEAIRDRGQAVVAVVINAVDKELSGSSQYVRDWNISRIKGLRALFDEARDAGRVVVLTADHGHVWFDQPRTQVAEGGSRWRPGTDAGPDEAVVAGPDGPVVVPVVEELRYRPSAGAGTHGGATPQEVLVPLWVLWPSSLADGVPPSAPLEVPTFWDPSAQSLRVEVAVPLTAAVDPSTSGLPLFDAAPPAPASGGLGAELAGSEVFKGRLRAFGGRVTAETITSLVGLLADHGGRLALDQVSARMELGVPRLRGLVAVAIRVLNVDGFQILALDEAERALRLQADLLRAQFGLEDA
ncbi:MAG: BREX-2 system phosphatase PglZ [Myxococcales bacterium]|nr:BREX-2 system phosphatase PglZ [Myxococcales bacterium]